MYKLVLFTNPRLPAGYYIDRFRLNKVWFWSVAHIICGLCALIVGYNESVYSVLVLAAALGKFWFITMMRKLNIENGLIRSLTMTMSCNNQVQCFSEVTLLFLSRSYGYNHGSITGIYHD